MTLRQKQMAFALGVAALICRHFGLDKVAEVIVKELRRRVRDNDWANGVTFGEVWRHPETVKVFARQGIGSGTSVHPDRLAVDLNLFKNNRYLTKTSHHEEQGRWWEEIHPDFRWGGDFNDGNHYSMTPDGRRA